MVRSRSPFRLVDPEEMSTHAMQLIVAYLDKVSWLLRFLRYQLAVSFIVCITDVMVTDLVCSTVHRAA